MRPVFQGERLLDVFRLARLQDPPLLLITLGRGVWEDLPEGWEDVFGSIMDLMPRRIEEYEDLIA